MELCCIGANMLGNLLFFFHLVVVVMVMVSLSSLIQLCLSQLLMLVVLHLFLSSFFFFSPFSSLFSLFFCPISFVFFLFLFFLANQSNGGNYFGGHSREEVAWKILSKYSGETWKEEAADLQMKQPGEVESDSNESGEDSELEIEGLPEGMELNSNLELVDELIRIKREKKNAQQKRQRRQQKRQRRQKQHEKKKLKVSTPRNKLVGCSLVLSSSGGGYRYGKITKVLASDWLLAEVDKHAKMDIHVEPVSTQKKPRGKWRMWKHGGKILKYGDSKEALCLWLLVRIC